MIGAQNGKGGFFPKGIQGKINKPVGFDKLAEATEDWNGLREAEQVCNEMLTRSNALHPGLLSSFAVKCLLPNCQLHACIMLGSVSIESLELLDGASLLLSISGQSDRDCCAA